MISIEKTCLMHHSLNEIYCNTCKVYLCPECITVHDLDLSDHEYMHITQYANKYALDKIDQFIESAPTKEKEANEELKCLNEGLKEILPAFTELINTHEKHYKCIKDLVSQFPYSINSKKYLNPLSNLENQFKQDKEMLGRFIETGNVSSTLKIAQKIDEEEGILSKHTQAITFLMNLRNNVEKLSSSRSISQAIEISKKLLAKYEAYKILPYFKDWKCSREHLPVNITLSEDGLKIGISNSNGYPGIVGDHPFTDGLYAFEVIPQGLDCKGKEGFGIIEESLYKSAVEENSEIPVVHDKMIGFFYQNEVKKITSDQVNDMEMGSKYFVRVDMISHKMTITGPGVSLWTELNANTVYLPCFSCGCTGNKFDIRPLTGFSEPDPSMMEKIS